ncbi:MAG: tetratricopeptide repeat protein [Ignavibacteriaceae bacterium]|nr:tetratricopeptide repeat protein [Ignavibacteriaceae bacterium]
MRFKPVYIYVVLVLAAVALFIFIPQSNGSKKTADLTNEEMPQDDIHKGLDSKQGPPNKDNVTGNIKHQMDMMKKAVEENPNDTLVVKDYADFLAAAHRRDEAIPLYERILKIDPKRSDILFNLAFIYYGEQKFDKAKETTKRILKIAPDDLRAHYNLGAIAQAEGNTAEAKEIWTELAEKHAATETGKLAKESIDKLNR